MKRAVALLFVIGALLGSCGDGADGFSAEEVSQLAAACNWLEGDRDAVPQEVRDAFVDPVEGSFRWVLESDVVRAGETFQVAGVNDTDQPVEYGAIHSVERLAADDWVLAANFPRQAISFEVPAGEVGPCFDVRTRQDATPGRYRVVQDVRFDPASRDGRQVAGEFEVVGD